MVELKPCPFCDGMTHELDDCGYNPEYGEGVHLALEWDDGRPSIIAVGSYDGGYCCDSAHADIAFCPFCGRRLVGDETD